MKPKFYIDYPQEKIEPGVNSYRCSFCKINCLEINGLLYKHKVNCEYRLKHEKLFNESK